MIPRQTTLLLSIIILILFIAGCYEDFSSQKDNHDISAVEAHKMIQDNINNPDFVIIDVRSENEFLQGHIENAVLIPYSSPDREKALSKLGKNKTYLLYCLFGGRSSSMFEKMIKLGFKKVYDLDGGIIEWKNEGFEVISE